ncbi:response regulator [Allosphingosinicella flava]|uniref:histidine kinase n=1 Tax=Allosphingosinicella flava TaxID=2771430 RepID=A0A7T2GLT7_9SPHN|nr:response regulator [Sphingosinicella flava]QPQ56151.1 response regulator [Sphingosinicella flava]
MAETTAAAGKHEHKWLLNVGIAAIPLVLLLLVLLLAQEFRTSIALRDQIDRSVEQRDRFQSLLSLFQDVETGQRGYLLTGDQQFLAPYLVARSQLKRDLGSLTSQADLRPELQPEMTRLAEIAEAKLAFADLTVRLNDEGRRAEMIATVRSGEGKRLMDAIRARISRLDGAQRIWMSDAQEQARALRKRILLWTFGLLVGLAVFLTFAAILNARSLSARRRALDLLEDTTARQLAILDSASDGIITLNPSGSLETANRAAEKMFGYDGGALLRRDVGVLFEIAPDGGDAGSFIERLRRRSNGKIASSEQIWARRSDGTAFPVEVSLSPMDLADGTHFVAVVRDITERREIEQMKSEFVSTVSHELRTPLTSIAGSLGLLLGGAAGVLPERAARLIQIAHSNSERLVRLINDILDIEKIESGRIEFDIRPVLIQPLLRQAVQANQGFADSYDVHLALEPGDENMHVLADHDRLIQVVTNLISNAVKFSPAGGTVRIGTSALDRRCRITVTDHGGGIPAAFQSRIFSKFAQADSSDARQKGGTGLGLSIVKEIVARLGGSVSFETVEGEGTVFNVDLPAVPGDAARAGSEQRILICDSDAASAEEIERALTDADFVCDVVGSADQLHGRLEETRYAAIILDLLLPDEDGIGLIRSLRADQRHASTPIIVVSGQASAADGEISHALPIVDWLQKPLPLDRLTARVREMLETHRNGQPRILHVDDDPDVLNIVATAFDRKAAVCSVPGLETARAALAGQTFDLVILDLGLADGSGLELLPDLRRADGEPIPVVIFSAQDADPRLARAVDAVLTKSRASLGRLVDTVESLVGAPRDQERMAG